MTIDEGGVPRAGLSDYVSGVFAERAQQKAEAQRVNDAVLQARLDQFVQKTQPIRSYLLQLATPIEEILARFRTREVLGDARVMLLNQQGADNRSFFTRGLGRFFSDFKNYEVSELRPPIYQQIVSPSQPTTSFQLESASVDLEFLTDPNNFRRVISSLEGYGLNLGYKGQVVMQAPDRRRVWVEASSSHISWSVGGGDIWSSQPAHWSWDVFPGDVKLEITRSLSVIAVRSMDSQGYDLIYGDRLERTDLRAEEHKYPSQDAQKYLTPQRRIYAGDPPETLMEIIGNDIVKEVSGENSDLIYKFLTAKVSKTIGGDTISPF